MGNAVTLTGDNLTLKDAMRVAAGAPVSMSKVVLKRVEKCHRFVEKIAASSTSFYGINTGFGLNAHHKISPSDIQLLQLNLIKSHAVGYGTLLTLPETRLMLALRLNVLLRGYTGVRVEVCIALLNLLECEIYPCIPSYGSVGASGDLAPLAHLVLSLIGEGEVQFQGKIVSAKKALNACGLKPVVLAAKEGLGLINGTQGMLAIGGIALDKSLKLLDLADITTALTFEGLRGRYQALDPRLHKLRNQPGQIISAETMRKALEGSYLLKNHHERLQDPYSLRCAPQVHGASRDALGYVQGVVERELNAVTDNPLVFVETGEVISGGNFHGQPLAIAFDTASMAVAELANISERRLELLLNPRFSGLSPFLAAKPGLESGLMATQYLSAALVNEDKILSHPACTDSIPGNAGIEDHVSMGMTSAQKFKKIQANALVCLAIELIAACQAIDLQKIKQMGKGTRALYKFVRKYVTCLKGDRILSEDIQALVKHLEEKL